MKLAITSEGATLDANIEERFGRWPYYLILDSDTMEFEAIPNPDLQLSGWAGRQSLDLMREKGISFVLAGTCGTSTLKAFEKAGIQLIPRMSGRVRDVVEQFKAGVLRHSPDSKVSDHLGIIKTFGEDGP